ncbi:unnamed protein product [Camellia sinensis]
MKLYARIFGIHRRELSLEFKETNSLMYRSLSRSSEKLISRDFHNYLRSSHKVFARARNKLFQVCMQKQFFARASNASLERTMTSFRIAPFDPTKKKKKKKKKKEEEVVIQDPANDAVDNLSEKTESLSVSDGLESTFSGLKKKKKKSKESAGDNLDDHIGEDEEGEGMVLQPQFPWEGNDRDYKYEELLDRVFHILRENNPELAGDVEHYEYVICNGCKSPDTILSKENHLFFLRCEKCGFGRSVAPIKAGFVAHVGCRKAGT